jgi:hypothetical protein
LRRAGNGVPPDGFAGRGERLGSWMGGVMRTNLWKLGQATIPTDEGTGQPKPSERCFRSSRIRTEVERRLWPSFVRNPQFVASRQRASGRGSRWEIRWFSLQWL